MSAVVFAFLVATASGRRVIQAADSDIVLDFSSRLLSESSMMYGGYGYGGYYTPADVPEFTEEPVDEPVSTPPPVEVVMTPPPVEVVMTPPPVEVVMTPPPVEVVMTPPPVGFVSVAPPPEEVVMTPPPVEVVMTPPPVEVVSIAPPPEEVVMTPPPVGVVSVAPPPEEVVMTSPPVEIVMTPPPVEVVSIAPPPEEVVMTPPPVEVAMPPSEEVAATPPPPFADALINDSQEGLPFPPANPDGGSGQFSNIPGCSIDHVAEGSPGCELCQPGFFKLDNDNIANGDEICYPCDALENCAFCNDYFGCAQCDEGFTPKLNNIVVYNDSTQYFGVTFCVKPVTF